MRHTATHQGVPLVVRGVVISKVGDDLVSVAVTARRFLAQQDWMHQPGAPARRCDERDARIARAGADQLATRRQADAFMDSALRKLGAGRSKH